jgi:predicted secreted hydrolase
VTNIPDNELFNAGLLRPAKIAGRSNPKEITATWRIINAMKNIQYTTSPGVPHQSMADEFLYHKRGPEWWYATGYMTDEDGALFAYQFTLAKIKI